MTGVAFVEIINDVDAANEGHAGVDHHQLPVQAAQAVPVQRQLAPFAAEDQHLHATGKHFRHRVSDEIAPAKTIDRHPHDDAALGGAAQCGGNRPCRVVVVENVGLQKDFAPGVVDRGFERREILLPVLQQTDRIALDEARQAIGSSSAVSNAWSEIFAQGAPKWTSARRTRKPRT